MSATAYAVVRRGIAFILFALVSVFMFGAVSAQSWASATAYAVTMDNMLITFNASTPQTVTSTISINGLQPGENIVGIDIRPATGQIFGISSASRVYRIDPISGAATPAGNNLANPLDGSAFGFDFNPTVDRIRLTSNTRQDLRLNPNNGALAAADGALAFNSSDRNASATPNIVASAYTNNFGTATATTLYDIDASLDLLVTQNPPNNGTLNTIGSLGVDATANTGFDIMSDSLGSDAAFAAIDNNFYTINLATGQATLIGSIGSSQPIRAIAVTGSMGTAAGVPMCANFDGSTSPVVRAVFGGGTGAFCRVLYENRQAISSASPAQVGVQSVLNSGVIQAVDVFTLESTASLTSPAQVCLLGEGNFIFLDATQSPRSPQLLQTNWMDGYTCSSIPNTGTVVLVNN